MKFSLKRTLLACISAWTESALAANLTGRDVHIDVEARLRAVALDSVQHFHETLLERPEEVTPALALEASKVYLDRAGHAPVNRSVNKNLNLNIGARMDRAAAEKAP